MAQPNPTSPNPSPPVQRAPEPEGQSTRSQGARGAESLANEDDTEIRVSGADAGRGSTRASREGAAEDAEVLEERERELDVQSTDADMEVFEGHTPVSESFSRPPTNNDPPEE